MGLGIAGSEPGSLVPVEPLATWEGHWEKGTPESSSATATFELVNRGGRPVHITETKSGCGCAKPQVDIETVKPGQTVRVNVSAIPISTGVKDVPITVISDSPTTPEVPLPSASSARASRPTSIRLPATCRSAANTLPTCTRP